MIRTYLKTALRVFARQKLFTFINVIGLSIGINAALVIFLIVYRDFTFDKFHQDKERIYRVVSDFSYAGDAFYNSGVMVGVPEAIKNEISGMEQSAPAFGVSYSVLVPGKMPAKFKNIENILYADQRYFHIFTYKWLVGSPAVLDEPGKVVLGTEDARKFFPGLSFQQMLGKLVIYDDSIQTVIAGIVQEFNQNTDFAFEDFISYSTTNTVAGLKQELKPRESTDGDFECFVKLTPTAMPNSIDKQLHTVLEKYAPSLSGTTGYKGDLRLQPLSDIHFNANYWAINNPPVNKTTLYGLMAIAVFLLLLGCINFVNLTTAQASQRAKEIGIRKTMGSSRGQLVGQFLSETFLVTLFAVMISVALAPFILQLFGDFVAKDVRLDLLRHPVIPLFLFLLITVVSLVSGFYPAMMLSGFQPVLVLKNQAYGGTGRSRNAFLRKVLTVTQFIIAQFFIISTILVSKQVYYALHKDLGCESPPS